MVDRAAPELRAKAGEVRGSALASLQRRRESAEAMESAAGAWAEAGRANSVAAALAGAARQYALLADHDAAKDGSLRADVVRAAYRAARAAAGAGNAALARTMMDLARRWAPTGDPAIQTRLAHPPFLTEDTALPTPTP
jgi:hypothetical protein